MGKQAKAENRNRLEDRNEDTQELEAVKSLLTHLQLWQQAVDLISARKEVCSKRLRSVVIWLAGFLLYGNHQQPGSIANAKISE